MVTPCSFKTDQRTNRYFYKLQYKLKIYVKLILVIAGASMVSKFYMQLRKHPKPCTL